MNTIHMKDRAVGRNIAARLAWRGLLQRDLAAAIKMDTATLSRAIQGKRRWTLDELERVAEFFDLGVAELLQPEPTGESGPPTDPPRKGRRRGGPSTQASDSSSCNVSNIVKLRSRTQPDTQAA